MKNLLKKINQFLFATLGGLLVFGCNSNDNKKLTSINNGAAHFANGETVQIPHFDDPAYLIIFAVRHCEKAQDGTKNPDLTPEGRARAARLGKIMENVRIDKVCSTNMKRTIQTGDAVALATGGPVRETFPPDAQNDWLAEVMEGGGGKKIFYVGHQNTVPALMNALLEKMQFQDLGETEFGRFFVIVTKGIGQTEVLEYQY